MAKVKQVDRDFAASRLSSSRKDIWEARIKAGQADESYWVQTFADYREYLADKMREWMYAPIEEFDYRGEFEKGLNDGRE